MDSSAIQTLRLRLVAHTPEQLRTLREGIEQYERRFGIRLAEGLRGFLVSDEVSPEWLKRLETATSADPWVYGFGVLHPEDDRMIGMGGYKGPPDSDGVVEIAYGIVPAYEGNGYATEVARALVAYAVEGGLARTVRARWRRGNPRHWPRWIAGAPMTTINKHHYVLAVPDAARTAEFFAHQLVIQNCPGRRPWLSLRFHGRLMIVLNREEGSTGT